jgi:hypothetical protein
LKLHPLKISYQCHNKFLNQIWFDISKRHLSDSKSFWKLTHNTSNGNNLCYKSFFWENMAPLYYSTTQELFQHSKEGQKWIQSKIKLWLLSFTSTNFRFINGSCFDLCLDLESSQLVSFVLPQPWLWAQVNGQIKII